ncbi:MAG: class I SAM-dependent methyltransferase [Pseudanabaenaceae cyanobacterium bins.39]|nr:class I SAM-dependent methyltransferase [Pseudanabaenaceae cyanobacterium bins.39]
MDTEQQPVFAELLNRYTYVSGELSMPCVPALLNTYMQRLEQMFTSLGKPFSKVDLATLQKFLIDYLSQGYKAGSNTYLTIKYSPTKSPDTGVSYTVSYAVNPNIQPAHNNYDLEMRVPAMLGMSPRDRPSPNLTSNLKLGDKTATLQILNVPVKTGLDNPQETPNFLKTINQYTQVKGEIVMPCMPSLLDVYMAKLKKFFISVGKAYSVADLHTLRQLLEENLHKGCAVSPLSKIVVRYESIDYPNLGVNYQVAYSITSIAEQYQNWVDTRTPPLFGKSADAKVMDTIATLGNPHDLRVLDIGAGTGRNILPLAQLGCRAEVLELSPALVEQLQKDAQAQNLHVEAIVGDILDPELQLQPNAYNLIICAEVVASHFRNVQQIRTLLTKVSQALTPSGLFLFNLFIAHDDYHPNAIAREFSEVVWSCMFTNTDLATAFEGVPLDIIGNDSVFTYEHTHLPAEDWPPTGWFENWTQGKDLFRFERSQMELRWILCKRN